MFETQAVVCVVVFLWGPAINSRLVLGVSCLHPKTAGIGSIWPLLPLPPRKRWGNKETRLFWVPQLFVVHHCCHLLDWIPSYHCHILRIHVLYTFWINTSSVAIFKESRHVLQPFTTTCSVAKTFSKESLLDRCSYHILCLYFWRLYITVWQSCKASGQITAY